MEFEEQIKSITNNIHNRVITYINDNKGNDDIFYRYCYLNVDDNMQIIFHFDTLNLFITDKNDVVYGVYPNYNVKINNNDTKLWTEDLRFDILSKTIQKYLSKDVKGKILDYYKKLDKKIDKLQYNTDKTQAVYNFKDDVFDVYNEYMYEKEFNNMRQSNSNVLPVVDVAVDWWANKIREGKRSNIGNDFDSKKINKLANILVSPTKITDEQLDKFKEILYHKLMNALYENDDVIKMECDYGPDVFLYEAMKKSGINLCNTPFKTNMYIRAYCVSVKDGYCSKDELLYDSTDNDDIKKVKKLFVKELEKKKLR